MSLWKCLRAAVLAVIPAAAVACGTPTGPTLQPNAAAAQRAPDARANLRSGYVLASGRNTTTQEQ